MPAGCLNSGGATTVVIGAAKEFCFEDGANRDDADFSDTGLLALDDPKGNFNNNPFVMKFTFDPNIMLTVVEISDTFLHGGMNFAVMGNMLTLSWAGGPVTDTAMRATYSIDAQIIPEPGSALLIGAGLLAAGLIGRRRLTR